MFGFRKNSMICSYVPKQNKSVLLLSTKHRSDAIVGDKKKPFVIQFNPLMWLFNETKAGVDTMDKMLCTYSTKRKTTRWPQAFFFNIIDVVGIAYIIYCDHNPGQNNTVKQSRRRMLITEMWQDICYSLIQDRAARPLFTRNLSVKDAMECVMGISINEINSQDDNVTFVADQDEDKTGRRKHKGDCHICKSGNEKRRSARKGCIECKRAVCKEHSVDSTKCRHCCMK